MLSSFLMSYKGRRVCDLINSLTINQLHIVSQSSPTSLRVVRAILDDGWYFSGDTWMHTHTTYHALQNYLVFGRAWIITIGIIYSASNDWEVIIIDRCFWHVLASIVLFILQSLVDLVGTGYINLTKNACLRNNVFWK